MTVVTLYLCRNDIYEKKKNYTKTSMFVCHELDSTNPFANG